MHLSKLFQYVPLLVILLALLFLAQVVASWTGPTASPPNNNVAAPINVGTIDQIKEAGLGLNSLAVFGNAILSGTSRYLNFGSTVGSSGYGFRDNAGTMEYKDSAGQWAAFGTGGGGQDGEDGSGVDPGTLCGLGSRSCTAGVGCGPFISIATCKGSPVMTSAGIKNQPYKFVPSCPTGYTISTPDDSDSIEAGNEVGFRTCVKN